MNLCICGNDGGRPFTVAERQLGLGHEFIYLECPACGSLRLQTAPPDLSPYYPSNYYSFDKPVAGLRGRLNRIAMKLALRSPFPRVSMMYFPWAWLVQAIGIRPSQRLLDVGSGVNGLATHLRSADHPNVLAIDPFIPHDVYDDRGLAIKKTFLSGIADKWDLITFNHSLEHTTDPAAELALARARLSPRGQIIVRIPIAAFAWREYGPCWYQIDAPRHFFVPTQRGFAQLAASVGLRVVRTIYDSDYKQFWHSEHYRQGLSLLSVRSRYWELITRSQRRKMNRRARRLNRLGDGDQAIFFLAPS